MKTNFLAAGFAVGVFLLTACTESPDSATGEKSDSGQATGQTMDSAQGKEQPMTEPAGEAATGTGSATEGGVEPAENADPDRAEDKGDSMPESDQSPGMEQAEEPKVE